MVANAVHQQVHALVVISGTLKNHAAFTKETANRTNNGMEQTADVNKVSSTSATNAHNVHRAQYLMVEHATEEQITNVEILIHSIMDTNVCVFLAIGNLQEAV